MGKRRRAREITLSILYGMETKSEWSLSPFIEEIKRQTKNDNQIYDYSFKILETILMKKEKIDNLIKKYSQNWSFDRISIIDKGILRIAIAEFYMYTPKTAVINEALEIAEIYGEMDSKSFINALLDIISLNLE
jgi:transcription antitermination protein NusB